MAALDTDLALTVIRVAVGLVVAGHGAQKLFGSFGGPGLQRWHGAVGSMGLAQPRVFATLAAFAEFFGGLMAAVGLLVPIAAAMLAIDMGVAIWKVHASKGFWVTKGGYEYALVLLVVFVVLGFDGTTRYSLDMVLGLGASVPLFLVTLLVGGLVTAGAGVARREVHRTA